MSGPAAQPAARSRLPPGWCHARKRGGSPWRELPHGRHAVVSLGRDGRWRLGLFGGSDGREWWPLAVPDLAMEAEACAAADRALAERLARERAGPFQLSARVRRIAALHWQLLGDWLDIVELGVSPGHRVAAVARWEFFKARTARGPGRHGRPADLPGPPDTHGCRPDPDARGSGSRKRGDRRRQPTANRAGSRRSGERSR